jgi:hypothetical protein
MIHALKGTAVSSLAFTLWMPIVFLIFLRLPPRRAVLVSLMGGWMFLPQAAYAVQSAPNIDKIFMVTVAPLLGILAFDRPSLSRLRFRWYDTPIIVLCVSPFFTSVGNGLGPYDGLAWGLSTFIQWGIPYLFGRIYFSDLAGLRELAMAMFVCGLVYVPLCLWEVRMSPQLHRQIYGFGVGGQFNMSQRLGGFRPTVFMQHGIMVGNWMGAATLAGITLWRTRSVKSIFDVPMLVWVAVLAFTFLLVKSLGALALFGTGALVVFSMRSFLMRSAIVFLVSASVLYILLRATGLWEAEALINYAAKVSEDRAQSLEVRIGMEIPLVERAQDRLLLGWGRWERFRVRNSKGTNVSISDSLWIITFGTRGVVGLAAVLMVVLLPPILLFRRIPARLWSHPAVSPAICLALIICLWMSDNLVNDMFFPSAVVAAGGLMGLNPIYVGARPPSRR